MYVMQTLKRCGQFAGIKVLDNLSTTSPRRQNTEVLRLASGITLS